MVLILKRPRLVIDWEASTEDRIVWIPIPTGKHSIEQVPNPHAYDHNGDLLVLKGTMIGAPAVCFYAFIGPQHGQYQVEIF